MNQQSLSIKNLIPILMRWGNIKIGRKGKLVRNEFYMPEKLDHFLITTMEKSDNKNFDLDNELMDKIKSKLGVEKLTKIPVTLLYNDIALNFISRYICYHGRTKFCSGDGETAMMFNNKSKKYEARQCPCERIEPDYPGEDRSGKGKCKPSGCLSVLIQGAEIVGGVWQFRTTGINSVRALIASLLLIKEQTGGLLAGLPLSMVLRPKLATNPIDGKSVTIYVVTLIYEGSPQQLRKVAYEIAEADTKHLLKIENVENEVRKMLTVSAETIDSEVTGGDGDEFVDEFSPEDATPDNAEKKDESTIEPPKEDKPKQIREKKKKEPAEHQETKVEPKTEMEIKETDIEDNDGFDLFD